MTTKTVLTEVLENDFLDDAVTAQYVITRLIDETLAKLAAAEDGDDGRATGGDSRRRDQAVWDRVETLA